MIETYSFGAWLKGRREHLRLTQRQLAAATYCSAAMIKKIEADERQPSPELAALLASALKLPQSDQELFIEVARGARPADTLWHIDGEAAAPSLPFHAPLPLPKPATPFVGRGDELAQIGERLARPECRLISLVGPGGVGKTRLALAVGETHESTFVDGVAFAPLAAITDASLIPDAVARALRLTLTGEAAEQVLAYLRRRRMLLILDNCEQVEGELGWLTELAAAAPDVKILATSRERLHLAEEWVFVVPELEQAATLFIETALRVKQDFDVEAERADLLRICQLVENLPLAVELAASWTPLMPCTRIAEHLQRDINLLTADTRNVPERHRSIQAVFDHSWKLLTAAEQNTLMRLSVFRGGWRAEEGQAVAGADLPALRRLIDKSLVKVGEHGRYDLHELIRQYAAQKLAQSGQEHETQARHFDAYLALAVQLHAAQFAPDGMEAVMGFDREQANLRAALGWSLDHAQTDAALQLLYHLWFYLSRRGLYYEGGEWGLRAIRQAGERESLYLSAAMSTVSAALFIRGRYAEAEPLAFRSLEMARRLDDTEALILALGTYTFTGTNIEQALLFLHEGIALIEKTGSVAEMLPFFYQGAATWLHSAGRLAEAQDYYWKSITLFRQMGAVDFIADPLGSLGQLAVQEGRLQDAYDLTVESITAAQAAGYFGTFGAWGRSRLGLIQLYLGETEAAQSGLQEALDLFDDTRDIRVKQEALVMLSEVALGRGDIAAAVDHLAASLEICALLYRQLQATQKFAGTPDALPVDLLALCARAALVAAAQGQDTRAATLSGIADALRLQSNQIMIPPLQSKLDTMLAALRLRLPAETFAAAWENGQKMSLEQAFVYLLT